MPSRPPARARNETVAATLGLTLDAYLAGIRAGLDYCRMCAAWVEGHKMSSRTHVCLVHFNKLDKERKMQRGAR